MSASAENREWEKRVSGGKGPGFAMEKGYAGGKGSGGDTFTDVNQNLRHFNKEYSVLRNESGANRMETKKEEARQAHHDGKKKEHHGRHHEEKRHHKGRKHHARKGKR